MVRANTKMVAHRIYMWTTTLYVRYTGRKYGVGALTARFGAGKMSIRSRRRSSQEVKIVEVWSCLVS